MFTLTDKTHHRLFLLQTNCIFVHSCFFFFNLFLTTNKYWFLLRDKILDLLIYYAETRNICVPNIDLRIFIYLLFFIFFPFFVTLSGRELRLWLLETFHLFVLNICYIWYVCEMSRDIRSYDIIVENFLYFGIICCHVWL